MVDPDASVTLAQTKMEVVHEDENPSSRQPANTSRMIPTPWSTSNISNGSLGASNAMKREDVPDESKVGIY